MSLSLAPLGAHADEFSQHVIHQLCREVGGGCRVLINRPGATTLHIEVPDANVAIKLAEFADQWRDVCRRNDEIQKRTLQVQAAQHRRQMLMRRACLATVAGIATFGIIVLLYLA